MPLSYSNYTIWLRVLLGNLSAPTRALTLATLPPVRGLSCWLSTVLGRWNGVFLFYCFCADKGLIWVHLWLEEVMKLHSFSFFNFFYIKNVISIFIFQTIISVYKILKLEIWLWRPDKLALRALKLWLMCGWRIVYHNIWNAASLGYFGHFWVCSHVGQCCWWPYVFLFFVCLSLNEKFKLKPLNEKF